MMEPKTKDRLVVKIPKIGISLIDGLASNRRELMYITMCGFEFFRKVTTDEDVSQVRLSYLNIDNTYDHSPLYPVILTPSLNLKHLEESKESQFDAYSTKAVDDSNITSYNMINLQMKPTTIKIEEKMIPGILRTKENFDRDAETLKHFFHQKFQILDTEDYSDNYDHSFNHVLNKNWLTADTEKTGASEIYVNNLGISEIKINFSFQKEYGSKMDNKLFKGNMGFISLLLTNIEGVDFFFEPVVHTGSCAPLNSLVNIIKS